MYPVDTWIFKAFIAVPWIQTFSFMFFMFYVLLIFITLMVLLCLFLIIFLHLECLLFKLSVHKKKQEEAEKNQKIIKRREQKRNNFYNLYLFSFCITLWLYFLFTNKHIYYLCSMYKTGKRWDKWQKRQKNTSSWHLPFFAAIFLLAFITMMLDYVDDHGSY